MKKPRKNKASRKYTQLEISINGVSILKNAHQQQLLVSARRYEVSTSDQHCISTVNPVGEDKK